MSEARSNGPTGDHGAPLDGTAVAPAVYANTQPCILPDGSIGIPPGPAGDAAPAPIRHYAGKTVVAVGAHPDDLELGVGGTLARMSRAGARVIGIIASVPSRFEERVAEAQRAAKIVGMAELRFLFPGQKIRVEDVRVEELVSRFSAQFDELRPHALLSHGRSDFHRDHVIVHDACLEASQGRFFDFFTYYPTMTRPVSVNFHPRVFVDISDSIQIKMDAIHAYPSQFQSRALDTEFCRAQAREHGRCVGVQYAEALQVVRMTLG